MKRSVVALAVTLGSVAGALLFRRRRAGRTDRAVAHYEDGSVVAFEPGSPQGDRLLAAARDVLAAAKS